MKWAPLLHVLRALRAPKAVVSFHEIQLRRRETGKRGRMRVEGVGVELQSDERLAAAVVLASSERIGCG